MISVIIPTYNSEKTIELCLKSVCSQTYRDFEIIVVDNYSADQTLAISKRYTNHIYLNKPERSAQRNYGIKKAKGDIVLYLDSDMVLSRNVLFEAIQKFKKKNIVALYVPEIVEGETFLAKILNFERSFYNKTSIDAVRFVRKDIFDRISGFDENLISAEDWDLTRRMSLYGKFEIIKSPLYHLQYHLDLLKYFRKKIFYAGRMSPYIQKWGFDDDILKKQLGFIYRYFYVFLENKKWKKVVSYPGLFILLYLIKLCTGMLFLFKRSILFTKQ